MSEQRMTRVGEQIQREIAEYLTSGKLKDDRIGFVTITGVKVTNDFREAKVYYAAHGSEAERKTTAEALADNAPRLRSHIGKVMKIHHAPALHFHADAAIEEGAKIDQILQDLRKKEGW